MVLNRTVSVVPDLRTMLGKYSVRQQYVCIAEFMKRPFSTFSLLNERGKSSFMQLSYVRFNVIHFWKHSSRPSRLQSHLTWKAMFFY